MAFGCLAGRILLATVVRGKVSDRKLLGTCYGLAMVIFLFMLLAPNLLILYIMYFVMSVFISAQSATTFAIGSDKFKGRAAVGIPMADAIGSAGSLLAPWIMGYLADQVGLVKALWLVPVFGFALTLVAIGWELLEQCPGGRAGPDRGPSRQ